MSFRLQFRGLGSERHGSPNCHLSDQRMHVFPFSSIKAVIVNQPHQLDSCRVGPAANKGDWPRYGITVRMPRTGQEQGHYN
jgi:hypothetical protein